MVIDEEITLRKLEVFLAFMRFGKPASCRTSWAPGNRQVCAAAPAVSWGNDAMRSANRWP